MREEFNVFADDDLSNFDAEGLALAPGYACGRLERNGGSIWYADYAAAGPAVVLLHGGLGNAGNFAKQVPALRHMGYRVIAIDSRGHGRSTRGPELLSYWTMADDVRAILEVLGLSRVAIVGWSDGADIALTMAHDTPDRVAGLFFFACNVDATGTRPFVMTETIGHCISRHRKDYAALSATPDAFDEFAEAVGRMQRSEPNYTHADLAAIRVPLVSALSAHDEFITLEHGRYIADAVPGAEFRQLDGVTHVAPIQRPEQFNAEVLRFLAKVAPVR